MPDERNPADTCPDCLGRGWVVEPDGGAGRARPCGCRRQDLIPHLVSLSGIPSRYGRCSLENFDTTNNEQLLRAKSLCQRYIESFVREDGRFCETGLLLIGAAGVGKTHLAVAVLSELTRRYAVRGLFADFTSLIHQIQSTFDPSSGESKHEILDPIMEADLLVLDELGAQKPTAWVSDVLYLIMNGRYTRRLPTLFTTNYRLDAPDAGPEDGELDKMPSVARRESLTQRIPGRLVSRLYEMTQPIEIHAGDFRREVKMAQHQI